jgi:hypothetical protein
MRTHRKNNKYVIKEIITDMYLFYQINVWLLKAKIIVS